MNPSEDDLVARWRAPAPRYRRFLPLLAVLWVVALFGSLLPSPWAPLLWWALSAPFALALRQVLYPQPRIEQPVQRTLALALGLLEVGGLLLVLGLAGALLGGLGMPAAMPLALTGGIVGWTLLGRGSAFRPLRALMAPLRTADAWTAWQRLRQAPAASPDDRALWVDQLALSGWLLLPWLLTLPTLVENLPLAPIAYAALLFPGLALWLVDLDPRRVGLDTDSTAAATWPDSEPAEAEAEPPRLVPAAQMVVDPALQLVAAVRRGDIASVHHWLEAGASPDSTPPAGAPDPRSALQSAVAAGDLDLLQLLLRAGADVNRLAHGRTALGEAVRHGDRGHPELLRALLAAGADPNLAEADGLQPLHHAARLADTVVADALLSAGALLDAVSVDGLTPLGMALRAGNGSMVAVLLDAGAALQPPAAVPVLHATVTGQDDAVDGLRLLQQRGAAFDVRDGAGQTALMLAASADHAAQVLALARAGCPVNAADAAGRTALMLAAAAGAKRALHALAELCVAADAIDDNGCSALHHAVAGGAADLETVEFLLGLGVSPGLRNAEGLSAEELAFAHARPALARLLSADGDERGDSLSLALQTEHRPAVAGSAVLERGDRLVQACAQHRFEVAHALIRQGPLPQSVWVEALLAAGDHLDADLRDVLLAAGMRIDALAHPSPQLLMARRLPCPAGPLALLLAAGASLDAEEGGDTLLALICGRAEDLAALKGAPSPPLTLLQAALSAGPSLSIRDRDGHAPLHYTIHHRPVEWTLALLDHGADPNAPDRGGRSALHHAVTAARPDRELLLRALILAGGDPAQPAVDGSTAQGLAAMAGEPVLAALCDFRPGEHPRHRLRPEDVPRAARAGQQRLLLKLLELGLPVDARDERQATALLHAAGLGNAALVGRLLDLGAQLALKSDKGVDALAAAVLGGRQDVVTLLLERGAHVNTDYAGMTPVALAASRADAAMLQLLLQRGGRVDSEVAERAPLALAIRAALQLQDPAPAFGCIDALLARRAPVDGRDAVGRTLLLYLCGSGANAPVIADGPVLLALVGRLLAAGADVNATDSYERNAGHWACRHHLPQLLALLLRHGVDTLKPDDMQKLPIDLVTMRRRHEFLDVLDQAGQDE